MILLFYLIDSSPVDIEYKILSQSSKWFDIYQEEYIKVVTYVPGHFEQNGIAWNNDHKVKLVEQLMTGIR